MGGGGAFVDQISILSSDLIIPSNCMWYVDVAEYYPDVVHFHVTMSLDWPPMAHIVDGG